MENNGEAASVVEGQMRILAEHLIGGTPSGKVKWTVYNNEFIARVAGYQVNLIPGSDSISLAVKTESGAWAEANRVMYIKI